MGADQKLYHFEEPENRFPRTMSWLIVERILSYKNYNYHNGVILNTLRQRKLFTLTERFSNLDGGNGRQRQGKYQINPELDSHNTMLGNTFVFWIFEFFLFV